MLKESCYDVEVSKALKKEETLKTSRVGHEIFLIGGHSFHSDFAY